MAIRDVSNAEVWVSATGGAGTFARIEDIESYDATHGSEGETRRRVFGKAEPYVRAGENTDEYSLSGLYNPDDTGGQNVLRASRDNRTTIFLAVLDDPSVGAEEGYQQEVRVGEYTDNGEADAEYLECSFTATGVGPRTALVGGLP